MVVDEREREDVNIALLQVGAEEGRLCVEGRGMRGRTDIWILPSKAQEFQVGVHHARDSSESSRRETECSSVSEHVQRIPRNSPGLEIVNGKDGARSSVAVVVRGID